ncbi:MAG: hypothetical protein JWO74_1742 [Solirubrobacterales bacterium]|nr:hypothetical protein [Solirubrobacterales bacterium]
MAPQAADRLFRIRDRMATRRPTRLPWLVGGIFGLWHYVILAVLARTTLVERFDGGILSSTVTFLSHGQLPYTDFYEPYGVGLGFFGLIPRILGFDGLLAERLTYAVLGALCTTLAMVVVWRRCGAPVALLVGLMTFPANVVRYSASFLMVFAFVLAVDRAYWRQRDAVPVREQGLDALAAAEPRLMLLASALLSLAGWIRTEYAIFAAIWAVFLFVAGRRRPGGWKLAAATLGLAALPALLVIVTGGLQELWWWASYSLSRGPMGFDAQRGQDIQWSMFSERLKEILRLHLESGDPGAILGSYGLAAAVALAAAGLLLTASGRRRLGADRSLVAPFLVVVSTIVLFGQVARFSSTYGAIALPIFAVGAALLAGRVPPRFLVPFGLLVVLPIVVPSALPLTVHDVYQARPAWRARESIPRLNYIAVQPNDGSAEMLASLPKAWRELGLQGRAVASLGLHNDLAWGNDTIVAYLLDAPSAAWPLTYDPGLVNADRVQKLTVDQLCRDLAPVVQLDGDYPYPPGIDPGQGSRRLDGFLAVNYDLRAVAGHYRVMLAAGRRCVRPERLSDAMIATLRNRRLAQGELAAAGALASLRLDRARAARRAIDPDDAAAAVLGGYRLRDGDDPHSALTPAVRSLADGQPRPVLVGLAARAWPSDLQALAAQTAWIQHGRQPGAPAEAAAAAAVRAMVLRHPDWPIASANAAAVVVPTKGLVARLADRGARGVPEFDAWRYGYAKSQGRLAAAVDAGLDIVNDRLRRHDPVAAGTMELELSNLPHLDPACAVALRRRADGRDGVYAPTPPGGPACTNPRIGP